MHSVWILDWHPVTVNRLLSGHWSRRTRLKIGDRDIVAAHCQLMAAIPEATRKRRVTLTFIGLRGDPDNRLKSCLDALVKCKMLVDDSAKWCEVTARGAKGAKATLIQLEDL